MSRVKIQPELIKWARERSGLAKDVIVSKFPKFLAWENGELSPTMNQLQSLAAKTQTPLGYFFLQNPPEYLLPIPDFRTVGDNELKRPSPNLLETVQLMQRRVDWMREFLIEEGQKNLEFVGSVSIKDSIDKVAKRIGETLGLVQGWAEDEKSWADALRLLRSKIENAGILMVINGVVGNNPHRKLDVSEFRGFALADAYAPLVFINGRDSKAAQMFTISHELVHIGLGQDGVSNFETLQPTKINIELFCNSVAAEFLIPKVELVNCWTNAKNTEEPFQCLARKFKVSPLVTARRCLDLNLINKSEFFSFYNHYLEDDRRRRAKSIGGNFWKTQSARVGHNFGAAVVRAAKEGRLLYREAYQLTGLHGTTFDRYAKNMGFNL